MSVHPWLEEKHWAVIGASENVESYGHKIYKKLKAHDYVVYPVTPSYETVDGDKAYSSLLEIEGPIDVAEFVVNPRVGIKVLDACHQKGIKKVWLQPGTVSDELLEKAESLGIETLQACVLVVLGYK